MKRRSLEFFLMVVLTCLFATCSEKTVITAYAEPSVQSEKVSRERRSEMRIIEIVNEERAKEGLEPLKEDDAMTSGARIRSQETVSLFSHNRPDGRDCFSVFTDLGIVSAYRGENLAYASLCTPEVIMSGWMNSEGHRKAILDPRFRRIGVGYYEVGEIGYWTQLFAE